MCETYTRRKPRGIQPSLVIRDPILLPVVYIYARGIDLGPLPTAVVFGDLLSRGHAGEVDGKRARVDDLHGLDTLALDLWFALPF